MSIANMKDNTQDNTKVFLKSEDGQKLILRKSALTLDRKLYEAQAEKMKSEEQNFSSEFFFKDPDTCRKGKERQA